MSHPMPETPGHYWAKLRLHDNPDLRSSDWEVVQVWDNILRPWCEADIETGECMMASAPGVDGPQPLDAFVWGPSVVPYPPAAPQPDHGVGETLVADFEAAVMNYWPVDKGLSASELGCRIDRLNETRNAVLVALKASEKRGE